MTLPSDPSAQPQDGKTLLSRLNLLGSALGPFLALALVFGIFAAADSVQADGGTFLTMRNVRTITAKTATVAVAALGMTVIIIAGGIDLSAGTALALCATVLAWCMKEDVAVYLVHGTNTTAAASKLEELGQSRAQLQSRVDRLQQTNAESPKLEELQGELQQFDTDLKTWTRTHEAVSRTSQRLSGYSPILAVLFCIGAGCLAGLLNGVLVSYLKVVPFIVTLGTMTIYLGAAKSLADETTVRPDKAAQIPEWLQEFTSIRSEALWMGFPAAVWLTLLLALLLAAILRYTVFGRYVFALGSNESTARLCGVNVRLYKIAVYTLAGLFIGIAGLYHFSRLSVGNPTSGTGLELRIIAAVVIGGGSLSGGRGSVAGTLAGAAIMEVIDSGCTMLGYRNPVQDIILGVIIIAAVAVDTLRQRRLAQ